MTDPISARPPLHEPVWGALVPVAPELWRVRDGKGRVVGHVRAVADEAGWRFLAQRLHLATGSFRDLGEFRAGTDALECLRG